MGHGHGSAQSCYGLRLPVKCEECKTYTREVRQRLGRTPGSYRYNQIHAPETDAYHKAVRNARRYQRGKYTAADTAELAGLIGGLNAEADASRTGT